MRRCWNVSALTVATAKLTTPEGRDAYLRAHLDDPEDWRSDLHKRPDGTQALVLDHVDPARAALTGVRPRRHQGQPAHPGGPSMRRTKCNHPECQESSIIGARHCPAHMTEA